MPDPTLDQYIRDARTAGKNEDEIRKGLADQGWPEHLIAAALTGHEPLAASVGILKPFGELFKESWESYGYLFGIFWPVLVLFFVVNIAEPLMKLGGIEASAVVGIVLGLAVFVLSLFLPIAEILALGEQESAERPTLVALLRAASRKFFGFFWVNLLKGLVTLGAAAALIVPGFILGVQTMFVPYTYLLENRRGLASIESSRTMVRGLGWTVFWRIFMFGLVILVVFLATALVSTLVVAPGISSVFRSGVTPESVPISARQQLLVAAISNLPNFLLFPLFAAFPFWLYQDLRRLRGVAASGAVRTDTKVFLWLGIVAAAVIVVFFVVAVAWFIASVTGTNPADWVSRLRTLRGRAD